MTRETYGDPNEFNYPKINGQTVTSVRKNGQGDVEEFKLQDGTTISYEEAVSHVKNKNAEGLLVQKGNQGQQILRSSPDAYQENNLDNLPTYE